MTPTKTLLRLINEVIGIALGKLDRCVFRRCMKEGTMAQKVSKSPLDDLRTAKAAWEEVKSYSNMVEVMKASKAHRAWVRSNLLLVMGGKV